MTSLRLRFARTQVNRTLHSLDTSLVSECCFVYTRKISTCVPLFFNHLQEITMVHDALKNRTESETIMSAKRGRESKDWHRTRNLLGVWPDRVLDCRVKVRQNAEVSGILLASWTGMQKSKLPDSRWGSCVVGFINNDSFHLGGIKLVQPIILKQRLVCSDCSVWYNPNVRQSSARMKIIISQICIAGCLMLASLLNLDVPLRKQLLRLSCRLQRKFNAIDYHQSAPCSRLFLWRRNARKKRDENRCLACTCGQRYANSRRPFLECIEAGIKTCLLVWSKRNTVSRLPYWMVVIWQSCSV